MRRRAVIREAVEAALRAADMRYAPTYFTIDIVTGLVDGPQIISVPCEMRTLAWTGREKVTLAHMGYRLTPL